MDEISTDSRRRWAKAGAALAVLALALAAAGPASAAKAKKCKKAGSGAAVTKRCKKKHPPVPPSPIPAPAPIPGPPPAPSPPPTPPPVLRVEIQWAEDADVDVHIWDSAGNHASTKTPGGIPGVSFSADDTDGSTGGGLEQVFAQPNEKLIVGICNNGSETLRSPDTGPTAVVKATAYEGATARQRQDLMIRPNEGSWAITSPDGPELPPGVSGDWCFPKRAEMTWDNAADLDLHVFDSAGNHASVSLPSGIPTAYMTADITNGAGATAYEEFFDRAFESKRTLYLYYCVKATNGVSGFYDIDLYLYEPPFVRHVSAFQGSIAQGDHGFLASMPQSAPYPPPFTLPNYCP
jgi:hypothetical protein